MGRRQSAFPARSFLLYPWGRANKCTAWQGPLLAMTPEAGVGLRNQWSRVRSWSPQGRRNDAVLDRGTASFRPAAGQAKGPAPILGAGPRYSWALLTARLVWPARGRHRPSRPETTRGYCTLRTSRIVGPTPEPMLLTPTSTLSMPRSRTFVSLAPPTTVQPVVP